MTALGIPAAYTGARPLRWLGFLGLALAVLCSAVARFTGLMIAPEGGLSKPIAFDGAGGSPTR